MPDIHYRGDQALENLLGLSYFKLQLFTTHIEP